MNNKFRLTKDLLDSLNDEELYVLIDIVPKGILLNFVKKNQKKFKNETRGLWLNLKSEITRDRLPKIYFSRIKKNDAIVIKFIEGSIRFIIDKVNNHIFKVTSDKDFLEKAITDNNIDNFSKLIDIILDVVSPEYLKLFFKLMNYKLSAEQYDYIDTHIKTITIKKQLEIEISTKLEEEYKIKIKDIEKQHREELANRARNIKEIKDKLDAVKTELLNEKRNVNLLNDKIKQIEMGKNDEIKNLRNCIEKLNSKMEELEEDRLKLKSSIKDKDLMIEDLNNKLNMRYEEYSITAKKQWNLENKELLNIQETLKNECEELEKTKQLLNNNIIMLEIEKKGLEDKLSEYRNIVNRFIENIDEKLIEKALEESLLRYSNSNSTKMQNKVDEAIDLCIKNNQPSANVEEYNNIHDFAENIAINLENIGVKGTADEVANYIIGILAAGLTPLICGYRTREIATAISASYSGETPYIISLPSGYTNSSKLLDIYNMTESNVILIEDAVGTMNENALMPLLRERAENELPSKLLLLSAENLDSVKYMPFNLLNQVAIVMVDDFALHKKSNYNFGNALKVFKEFVLFNDFEYRYKVARKAVKKLIRNLHLGSAYEILRSSIIAYSEKLSNVEAALAGFLRSELLFICQCYNKLTNLEENIQRSELGQSLKAIVRGGLDEL